MSGWLSRNQRPVCLIAAAIALVYACTALAASDPVVVHHDFALPMTPVTLRDLPRQELRVSDRQEHHEQRAFEHRDRAASLSAVALADAIVPSIPAPPVAAGFRSAYDLSRIYPSDANGAVGPRHVLSVSNVTYIMNDRAGNQVWWDTTAGFWRDPNVPLGGNEYDARAA